MKTKDLLTAFMYIVGIWAMSALGLLATLLSWKILFWWNAF